MTEFACGESAKIFWPCIVTILFRGDDVKSIIERKAHWYNPHRQCWSRIADSLRCGSVMAMRGWS